jgi:hypothetical protein
MIPPSSTEGHMIWQSLSFSSIGGFTSNFNYWDISTIPQLSVFTHPDFAWDTLVASVTAAIIASAIPAFIAWWSIRKNISTLREDREKQLQGLDKDRNAQVTISSNNIRAQIVSANRQAWINELRNASSEFGAEVLKIVYKRKQLYKEIEANLDHNYIKQLQLENIDEEYKMFLLFNKIILMINPEEEESKKVLYSMGRLKTMIDNLLKTGNIDVESLNREHGLFIRCIQFVLKKEWVRVKNNE